MKQAAIVTLLLILFSLSSLAAQNPLFKTNAKRDTVRSGTIADTSMKNAPIPWHARAKLKLTSWQAHIRNELYKHKEDMNSLSGLLIALALVFFYGFIHAVGPGHGKVFITSFAFSTRLKASRAFIGSFAIGLLHSIAALLLVVLLSYVFDSPVSRTSDIVRTRIEEIAFTVLLAIGLYMLIRSVFSKGHAHSNMSFWGLILSVGLVPCPGAVMISIYGLSILQSMSLSILMILVMGLGMSLAISLFALIPSLMSNARFFQNPIVWKIISITGSSFIILISAVYLFALL